ncbi:MAG: hypothetical protein ACRDJW_03720 [Thermomicrobiales bacterium]
MSDRIKQATERQTTAKPAAPRSPVSNAHERPEGGAEARPPVQPSMLAWSSPDGIPLLKRLAPQQQRHTLHALQRTHGNAAVQRLIVGPIAAPAVTAECAPIRRFGSGEHQSLGDTATGGTTVNLGGETGDERFELSYGDVIALSGDYFDPHELMNLAKEPGNRGTRQGTRDEIVYALKEAIGSDRRFQRGGIWASWVFTDGVKQAVERRYQERAAANTAHFAAPRGRDASGAPKPTAPGEASAGGTYRSRHEDALWLAYEAGGGRGGSLSHALAMEAAAGHFLTDAFAAGHVRTPIGEIRDYWGGKYPLFWYNLRHKIALDTAIAMNDQDTNAVTVFGSVQAIYEEISAEVEEMASDLPAVTLGDLLGKVFHDWDNEQGVTIQGGGKLFGDSHLDEAVRPGDAPNVTRNRAQDAIRAGTKEIEAAFTIGQSQAGLQKADVYKRVIGPTTGSGTEYAAEVMLPRPDAANPAMNWMAPSIEALWNQPIVQGAKETVGDRIIVALGSGGEIRGQLEGLATKFEESKRVYKKRIYLGTVHPRGAYRNGFLTPLLPGTGDPKAGVLSIVHWAPNYGLAGWDRDDVSLATGQELANGMKKGENLKGMTTVARIRYVRELTGGFVGDSEEQLVVQIFATAPVAERPAIYRGVEGHAWTGDWIHGVFTSDDEIWNALNRDRLKAVKTLINAGWSGRP